LIGVNDANFEKICGRVSEILAIKNWYKKENFPKWKSRLKTQNFVLITENLLTFQVIRKVNITSLLLHAG